KTLEVKCPMCETKGFISPKAAGKLVKCCNPECMVPIFTAPVVEKKQVPAPPPKPKSKLPWYIVGVVVVAGIAGASIWFKNQQGPMEIRADPRFVNRATPVDGSRPDGEQDPDIGANQKKNEDPDGKDAAAIARQQIVTDAVDHLVELSVNARIKSN